MLLQIATEEMYLLGVIYLVSAVAALPAPEKLRTNLPEIPPSPELPESYLEHHMKENPLTAPLPDPIPPEFDASKPSEAADKNDFEKQEPEKELDKDPNEFENFPDSKKSKESKESNESKLDESKESKEEFKKSKESKESKEDKSKGSKEEEWKPSESAQPNKEKDPKEEKQPNRPVFVEFEDGDKPEPPTGFISWFLNHFHWPSLPTIPFIHYKSVMKEDPYYIVEVVRENPL